MKLETLEKAINNYLGGGLVMSTSRETECIYARAIFIDKAIKLGIRQIQIARYLNKHHATVTNAKKKIEDTYMQDPVFVKMYKDIEKLIEFETLKDSSKERIYIYYTKQAETIARLQEENENLKKEVERLSSLNVSDELLRRISKLVEDKPAVTPRLEAFVKLNESAQFRT